MTVAVASDNMPGMGLIPHTQMDERDAREITREIQDRGVADLTVLVVRAFKGQAHIALGYESWSDYIKAEFNDAPLYLPRDDRRAVVEVLRGHGMSTRNIAAVTGVHHDTVAEDVKAGVGNPTPDADQAAAPATITGEDGKTYPGRQKPKPKPKPEPEVIDADRDKVSPGLYPLMPPAKGQTLKHKRMYDSNRESGRARTRKSGQKANVTIRHTERLVMAAVAQSQNGSNR